MYLKRDIDKVLLNWKEAERRKPVLLRGIRQCGKTSAIRNLSTKFKSFIEINFEKQPKLCAVFEGDIDIKRIIMQLELQFSQKIVVGKLCYLLMRFKNVLEQLRLCDIFMKKCQIFT